MLSLNPETGEMQTNYAVFKYIAGKKEAPVPKGSVGECNSMRKRILQMSLFPDIYDKRGNTGNPGNVDFGK